MRAHPTFYLRRLRPYRQYEPFFDDEDSSHVQEPPSGSCARSPDEQSGRIRDLSTQLRDLPASCHQLVNKRTDIPLDLKLRRGVIGAILRTIILTILAVIPHGTGESVASVSLVLRILAQSNDCEIHIVSIEKMSRITWIRIFRPPPHPLIDSQDGQRFFVERILNQRYDSGSRTTYSSSGEGIHPRGTAGSPALS